MGRISLADPQSLSWEECGTGSKKSCWREHCELICLSEVAKSLEAEEQAGYHQKAAYLCSFACLSFSSCFRAQSPCQCTNDNALFFFFSDDYMILLSQMKTRHLDLWGCLIFFVQNWGLEYTGCHCLHTEETTLLGMFLCILLSQQPSWLNYRNFWRDFGTKAEPVLRTAFS